MVIGSISQQGFRWYICIPDHKYSTLHPARIGMKEVCKHINTTVVRGDNLLAIKTISSPMFLYHAPYFLN